MPASVPASTTPTPLSTISASPVVSRSHVLCMQSSLSRLNCPGIRKPMGPAAHGTINRHGNDVIQRWYGNVWNINQTVFMIKTVIGRSALTSAKRQVVPSSRPWTAAKHCLDDAASSSSRSHYHHHVIHQIIFRLAATVGPVSRPFVMGAHVVADWHCQGPRLHDRPIQWLHCVAGRVEYHSLDSGTACGTSQATASAGS